MISISYITSRPEPRFDWFFSSLAAQLKSEDDVEVTVVDFFAYDDNRRYEVFRPAAHHQVPNVGWIAPKPTVWQGPNRLPKDNWWAAANARNTALCVAKGDWWACVDDRCVLMPGWMDAVRDAVKGNYAIIGPYQKRTGITVENGFIKHAGIVTGEDNRLDYVNHHYTLHESLKNPYSAPGSWWYGCTTCLPVEWALKVNGYPEDICDGLGSEDSLFGLTLQNNNFEIRYDTRFYIVEDRTLEFLGQVMRREDKGEIGTARDKSHAALAKLQASKTSLNSFDIRRLRESVLRGEPWPKPSALPYDWFDKQPLSQM